MNRKGFALPLVLVALAVASAACYSSLRWGQEAADIWRQEKNGAELFLSCQDGLSLAERWLIAERPGPASGERPAVAAGNGLEKLRLSLPSKIASQVSGGVNRKAEVFWPLYAVTSGSVADQAVLWPPDWSAQELEPGRKLYVIRVTGTVEATKERQEWEELVSIGTSGEEIRRLYRVKR